MRINQKNFKEACDGSGGVQAVVAQKLDVTRQAISIYLKRNPKMKIYLEESGEDILDVAEHNVNKKVIDGDYDASKWKLETKGKVRGYSKKQEVEHFGEVKGVSKLQLELVYGKPDDEDEVSGKPDANSSKK